MKGILLTTSQQKSLMPICFSASYPMLNFFDKPLIDVSIRLLQKNKISNATIVTDVMASDFENYLSLPPYENLTLQYLAEQNQTTSFELTESDQGCLVFPELPVSDMDFSEAIRFHHKQNNKITIIIPESMATATISSQTTIGEFRKKYASTNYCYVIDEPGHYTVTTNKTKDSPMILPPDTKVSLCPLKGYFKTISSSDEYQTVLKECLQNHWLMSTYQINNGVILNQNTFLEVGAKIKPPVYIGENVFIKKNAEILPYSILCRHCDIGENARISDSVLLDGCKISDNASLDGTMLGEHCNIDNNTQISHGSVYGAHSKVLCSATKKELPPAPVTTSESFSLTKHRIPISTESSHTFFMALGRACYQVFSNGIIGIFRDDSAKAELFSHSLQEGLQRCGISLYHFPECTLSMAKNACPFYHLKAGFYLYQENQQIFLSILDEKGYFISPSVQDALHIAIKTSSDIKFQNISKTTAVKPYQMYYYTEITRRLGFEAAPCYLTLDASPLIQEYAQKLATCHKITIISEERPGVIRFQTNSAGTDFTIFDENAHPLTQRQREAVIAELMIDDHEGDFVATITTPEIIRQTLLKHRINLLETENHPHSLDAALSMIPNQRYLLSDPVYLMIKILLYLSKKHLTLSQWVATLPKSFVIEKNVGYTEQLNDALTKLLKLAKNDYTKENEQYKIKSKKGVTLITPEKKHIKITSESEQEEFAKELTDFFVAQWNNQTDTF